ncbi:MAG: DUF1294 domain-containing protein [Gemmataceae bacterium]
MSRRRRPAVFHGTMAAVVVVALVGLLFAALPLPWTWYGLLAAYLITVTLVTFAYYGYDKWRARTGMSRVPEVVLHGLALAGGSIGAYAGMLVFRHKTVKAPFRLIFRITVVMQVLLIAAVLYRLWKNSGA